MHGRIFHEANSCAEAFAHVLQIHADFDIWKDAMIVPMIFCDLHPTRVNFLNCFAHTRPFLDKVQSVAVVSNDAYKGFFNEGSMPDLLYGKSMRDPRYPWNFFFFSDYRNLEEDQEEEQYWRRRLTTESACFRTFLRKGEA